MKSERLLDALGKIDDELIAEAAPEKKLPRKKKRKTKWMKWGAMAACVVIVVGISIPFVFKGESFVSGEPEETETESFAVSEEGQIEDSMASEDAKTENNVATDTTDNISEKAEAGVGEANLETLKHMEEIKIKIDEMLPNGFVGTIEVGTDLFKVGEQITIIVQDNVTVVQKDGSIFAYDELEPNIPESDLEVGNLVWVGYQSYDYVVGNGKYNQIFAYHVEAKERGMEDEGFPDWGITLSVKDVTDSGLTLVCTQSGGEADGELQTGSDYKLIVLKEAWEDVPTIIEDYGWTAEAYMIAKDDVTEFEINWEWLYGKLPKGTYRLTKGFMNFRGSGDFDNFPYWIEFEIK